MARTGSCNLRVFSPSYRVNTRFLNGNSQMVERSYLTCSKYGWRDGGEIVKAIAVQFDASLACVTLKLIKNEIRFVNKHRGDEITYILIKRHQGEHKLLR